MSWSFSVNNVTHAAADEALNKAAETQINNIMAGDAGDEALSQMEQATYAAVAILQSGALGAGPYLVQLSGHANPGHEQRPGWSQDSIRINVEQVNKATV